MWEGRMRSDGSLKFQPYTEFAVPSRTTACPLWCPDSPAEPDPANLSLARDNGEWHDPDTTVLASHTHIVCHLSTSSASYPIDRIYGDAIRLDVSRHVRVPI